VRHRCDAYINASLEATAPDVPLIPVFGAVPAALGADAVHEMTIA
jgi:hypothetical protein